MRIAGDEHQRGKRDRVAQTVARMFTASYLATPSIPPNNTPAPTINPDTSIPLSISSPSTPARIPTACNAPGTTRPGQNTKAAPAAQGRHCKATTRQPRLAPPRKAHSACRGSQRSLDKRSASRGFMAELHVTRVRCAYPGYWLTPPLWERLPAASFCRARKAGARGGTPLLQVCVVATDSGPDQ